MIVVLTNAAFFDGTSDELRSGHVVIEDGCIVDIADSLPSSDDRRRTISVQGRTLMPGLIDAHVHAYFPDVDATVGDRLPVTMVAHWAARMLAASLNRGFTTVRDTGGADWGLYGAIERGWVTGPRLIYCGKALSQTGGHGDMRDPHDTGWCGCSGYVGHSSRVVDGPDRVRIAIREELRRGASFIKIMGSGGVASPADPLERCQFSDEEISAAVDETRRHGSYVTAHVHPDEAIRRCIELGVPCLEHGTLISDATAALAAERDVSVVPTMAVIKALARHGRELGFPSVSLEKLAMIEPLALQSLECLHRAGVRTGFGTDLIGELERYQCTEFAIRGEVWAAADVLRSATAINAEILGIDDRVGQIAPGFDADLIAVSGNPLDDLNLFTDDGRNVPLVIKRGHIVKNEL